jgi:predicted permease
MARLVQDLRHSVRIFIKNPAFTLAALAALALGIGATTAIFSVVNAVLLRPLSMPDADRVVMFMNVSPQGTGGGASPTKFQHYRMQSDVVDAVSAFRPGVVNYTGGAAPEQLRLGQVSADFFRLFAAPIRLGRTFNREEDLPGGQKAVVLSKEVWEGRFSSDTNVVGRPMSLSGDSYVIVGVLGEFPFREFGPTPEVWTAFQLDPNSRDHGHFFQVAGRLKPGVTLEQAKAKLHASASAFREQYNNALPPDNSFTVERAGEVLVRNARTTLYVLAGAVSFVLLIACENVANLLLARATGRSREIAVRAAIGGSRGRIVRQLLTESLVLSIAGGVLGLALGLGGIRALLAVNTAGLPRVGEAGAFVSIDWRVALFAVGVSMLTGILFGLIPALHGSRVDLTSALREGAGRAGTGRQAWVRSSLVVTEVALALVLLIASALLIRTATALGRVDPGFDAKNVLTMRMSLSGTQSQTAAGVAQLVRTGVEALQAVPGVEVASATCCVPLQGGFGLPFQIAGRPLEGRPFHGQGGWINLAPGYFDVFRIPLKRGRTFTQHDDASAPPAVIINEAMARQYWPNADPLADRLIIGRGIMREFATESERQVIGIVGDTRDGGLNANPPPIMYIPQAQVPDLATALNARIMPMGWVVRTRTEPLAMSNALQEAVKQATGLPVANVRSMGQVVSLSTSRQRFNMWLMTIFGASALLLAAIGIYGLMSYTVAQRTQEMGIRLALGAETSKVRIMVVRQGATLAIIGTAIGLGAAYGLTKYLGTTLSSMLFQVQVPDPWVFAATPLVLFAVALIAVWIPARRASKVDPLTALRTAP